MKIVVFGRERRVGALVGEAVVDLNRASAQLPARLLNFIEAGAPALDEVRSASSKSLRIAAQRKMASSNHSAACNCTRPGRSGASPASAAITPQHLLGMWANRLGKTDITVEEVAARSEERPASGASGKYRRKWPGPNDTIPFPKRVTYFDYEGEVAIVIGKRGKNIPAAQDQRICLGRHVVS